MHFFKLRGRSSFDYGFERDKPITSGTTGVLLASMETENPVLIVSTEMENLSQPLWKNGPNSAKKFIQQNFQLPTPKVWVCGSPCVNRNRKFGSAITKKWKNSPNSAKTCHTAKFPITDPSKVWVSGSPCVNGNGKFRSAIMKKWKNGPNSAQARCTAKFPITDPPKVWVSGSPCINGSRKFGSAMMKK